MRVLTFGLSPVIQLGLRNPRKKERNDSDLMVPAVLGALAV